jgi:hypothetical protein
MDMPTDIEQFLEVYIKIQNKYNHIYLGGSIALILMGMLPERPVKDIDLISSQFITIEEIRTEFKSEKNLELFLNKNAEYIPFVHNKNVLKLSKPEEIIYFKLKKGFKGNKKHIEDVRNIMNNIY